MIRFIHLRVRTLRWEVEGILGLELVPLREDIELPAFEAGAHVDLHLPMPGGEQVRSYSLLNDPVERHRWCVAVQRERDGAGASEWIHTQLRPGQMLRVGAPRNHFALQDDPVPPLLLAGGIGITPILSMLHTLNRAGRGWTLHAAARSRRRMAFRAELQALADAAGPRGQLHLHADDEADGVLDVAGIVAAAPPDTPVYACGPVPMLQAVTTATAGWPPGRVRLEHFRVVPGVTSGFTVRLRRSGLDVPVRPGQTILEAVLAQGVPARHSCRAGFCGTCEVPVLAGEPEHADLILDAAQRAAGDRMFICCGGARTPVLELDL